MPWASPLGDPLGARTGLGFRAPMGPQIPMGGTQSRQRPYQFMLDWVLVRQRHPRRCSPGAPSALTYACERCTRAGLTLEESSPEFLNSLDS